MVATGIFGVVFYSWMPKVITRLEGESQLEEDLIDEWATIRRRRSSLETETPTARKTIDRAIASAGSIAACFPKTYDRGRTTSQALDRISDSMKSLPIASQREIESVVHDAVREVEIRAALLLYRMRVGWLVLHIGVASALFVLVLVHIATVLYY